MSENNVSTSPSGNASACYEIWSKKKDCYGMCPSIEKEVLTTWKQHSSAEGNLKKEIFDDGAQCVFSHC